MNFIKEPIKSSDQIIATARELGAAGRKKMVAVAGAQDVDVLGALASARDEGILEATLFGDKAVIRELAEKNGIDLAGFVIVNVAGAAAAAHEAVKMASEGDADVIMKGFVSTSALLKTVLAREFNLRTENTLSHTAVLGLPGYHKLLSITDGGMVVRPDREQKKQILENAAMVCRALGINPVRVALSGGVDKAYESIPHSTEVMHFIDEFASAGYTDVVLQGPLTLDAATSKEIAARKGIDGPVVGEADIYLVNTIEECNIITKSLINFAGAIFAGVIVGARVPVSLVSRTDTMTNKKASVSIACLIAEYYRSLDERGTA